MSEQSSASSDLYYRSKRNEVAQYVPAGVKRALDVGCAAGGFGSLLKDMGIEVWGIEPNAEIAAEAVQELDKVLIGVFAEVEGQLARASFDLVTFNDVLEHIADCDEVLLAVKQLLAPGGAVLASVPNVRSWPALMTIFWHADFPYQDQGVFDRTHLRFFTQKSMLRMFDQCGYEVVVCEGINSMVGPKLRIANFLTGGRFWDCKYLQFVILAKPKTVTA